MNDSTKVGTLEIEVEGDTNYSGGIEYLISFADVNNIISGITSTYKSAFPKDTNPNLSSITINKSCSDIKNNLKVGNNNYYPWLAYNSPYTSSGVTIYGANDEVCDTF